MFDKTIDDMHENHNELEECLHLDINQTKQQHIKQPISTRHTNIHSNLKQTLLISKQLTPYPTKLQSKVTIIGTDRTTFICALTMALKRHVSEIVVFDQCYNRQMKMCFYDLACAFQLCPISRSVNLIYTSDIAYTYRSDVILITEMNNNINKEQHNKTFSLKQKAQQFINNLHGVSPYDYNSLVVKSLAGNHCHAGQVCGLSSSIYNHRLRYAISQLLDIPSKHITGFILENPDKSIEPYWPSITINGQSIKLTKDDNREVEVIFIDQSMSNNASQNKYQSIKLNTIKNDTAMKKPKYSTKPLSNSNMKNFIKQTINQKKITSYHRKKYEPVLYTNKNTSVRIQQWIRSSTLLQSIKNNHKIFKQIKHYQQIESGISNNSTNIIESQQNLFQSIQDQLIKHLNGWHYLQILYHRPCYYTLGMSLCQVIRSIMSNSQEMLILSIYIESFLKQQFTNKIELENVNLFASIPILIRRYGIHAVLNFKSQDDCVIKQDPLIFVRCVEL
ncbi:unnamed protein product [Rotaria sordida]|uniref:Uncharacterized protein n=1 Tax=Rotaria sordida TaxID=392033 RepID=A0A818QEI1_9BILA|nr:unnamed protein product [Rotaria sordida]